MDVFVVSSEACTKTKHSIPPQSKDRGTGVQTYTIKKYTFLDLCGYTIHIFNIALN